MFVAQSPSGSSNQTLYYDALAMQSNEHSNTTGEVRESNPMVSGNLTRKGNRITEETGSPSTPADGETRHTPSLHSLPVEHDFEREQESERTPSKESGHNSVQRTRSTQTARTSSAFANGAPLTGPNAEPNIDQSLIARGAKAERSLSQKQKDRIAREEREDVRKLSKLLKMESSTEKVALDSALKNLSSLQSLHKAAIKRETKAQASYARALSTAQKAESIFQEEKARLAEVRARAEAKCMEERVRWEGKQGEVQAQQERLGAARDTVRETEVRITECAREVERLRIVKATDEREREAKLTELAGPEA